eukprot:230511-Pelagomonas_calceolata.AAC.3
MVPSTPGAPQEGWHAWELSLRPPEVVSLLCFLLQPWHAGIAGLPMATFGSCPYCYKAHTGTCPASLCSPQGKLHTEKMLAESGIPFTSIRPVYIYGPLNYNPVEEWFFHRIAAGRPVPVPSSGIQVTQLGHVKDLAAAFTKCLGNKKAYNQIYNISGKCARHSM